MALQLRIRSSLAQLQEHCRALSPEHPCSWTTCSSVTVRRVMTTNALQSQLRSVASSPSSSSETSDSESSVDWETVYSERSSGLEMETALSDGDVSDPPSAPAPEKLLCSQMYKKMVQLTGRAGELQESDLMKKSSGNCFSPERCVNKL
ncbi:uncharacterized protein LOC113992452 [Pipra filicauda]|uniref:Uncharacterized protein LOC113992452 n=1 Tax=Pipra filicauda TaxID=649802 RepID=A0A7R5L8K7_9PASS|nr:uncharacterized protein LOC113992452 [Pipra filicauda]